MKIILLLIIVTLLYSCKETQTNRYKSKEYVIKDGAIRRGWIPEIIPESSFNIIETHNLDTNTIKGSLQYKEIDEPYLINKLKNKMVLKNFKFTIDINKNHLKFKNKE
jgi:hypothetical protein